MKIRQPEPPFAFKPKQIRERNMEILVFALIAMRNGYRPPQEMFVPEPDEFQSFDVRALAKLFNIKNESSKLPTDPSPSFKAQVAS